MSLDKFKRSRLVVQLPSTRIYDAARAMEDHHIGAVLVHDGQALVGIVTDRDLGVKVLGDDLDAFEFTLSDIMSSPVASVPPSATVAEVAELMMQRHVRRIPILDGASIVGMVTLDDLIVEHGVDAFTLAAIVRSQLSEPSRLEPAGSLHPVGAARDEPSPEARARHAAHQRRAYARLLRRALALTQLTLTDQAESALQALLSGLVRRLTPEEAGDLLAQLPSRLREYVVATVPSGPDPAVSRESIEAEIDRRLEVGPERAREIAKQAARALSESISAGEIHDVRSQLPASLSELLGGHAAAARG